MVLQRMNPCQNWSDAVRKMVEEQLNIAQNYLAEAEAEGKMEGWDSATVEYAGKQQGKVLAFKAVLKILEDTRRL